MNTLNALVLYFQIWLYIALNCGIFILHKNLNLYRINALIDEGVKKMDNFQWKTIVRLNILALKLMGLWPQGDEPYKRNFYSLYAATVLIFILGGHNFFQIINIFFILNDFEAFTSMIFVTLSCIAGLLKAYSLIQNMDTLKQLFVTITTEMFLPKNPRQIKLIQPSIKTWRWIYVMLNLMGVICAIFWSTAPLLDKSKHRLPFLAWYPFETTTSPNYEVTYLYQVIGISFIIMVSANIDTLIAALNMVIGAQCDILCDNLKNLATDKIQENFKNCIKHHKAILELSTKCNNFFNWILLFQFFTSAVSLGFSMFLMTQVVPFTREFFSFMVYVNALVVEIFLYCWFGNEVETKSNKIPYSVFETNWLERPKVHRNIIIFTIRTQRGIKLSALNLFFLTLETFKTILRTSWSYFAVLNQVNS